MLRKLTNIILFSLIAILIQVLFVPWMTIREIRPDFILLVVMFIGRTEGRMVGQTYGFIIGLLVDALGMGSFLGLSALIKTCVGFFSGCMKNQRNRLYPFYYHAVHVAIILFSYVIFYLINYKGTEFSFYFIILRFVLPSTLYTLIFYVLIDYFISSGND
ncbi:MAG: rod shape-determining protein MreD [Candidatus Marinimicrobia bacterium CG08_land_8_20_14_0_20_45_22]|nr:MAG: rod shape-determining protein MreD [Candidatus Marinimicrobia bacterium CG08_land_8_20_14_0_20_45_22]